MFFCLLTIQLFIPNLEMLEPFILKRVLKVDIVSIFPGLGKES